MFEPAAMLDFLAVVVLNQLSAIVLALLNDFRILLFAVVERTVLTVLIALALDVLSTILDYLAVAVLARLSATVLALSTDFRILLLAAVTKIVLTSLTASTLDMLSAMLGSP
jgi:hypothetical protein